MTAELTGRDSSSSTTACRGGLRFAISKNGRVSEILVRWVKFFWCQCRKPPFLSAISASARIEIAHRQCNTSAAIREHRAHSLHVGLIVKPHMKSSASGIGVAVVTRP